MIYDKPEVLVLSEEDVEEIAPNCSGYNSSGGGGNSSGGGCPSWRNIPPWNSPFPPPKL